MGVGDNLPSAYHTILFNTQQAEDAEKIMYGPLWQMAHTMCYLMAKTG